MSQEKKMFINNLILAAILGVSTMYLYNTVSPFRFCLNTSITVAIGSSVVYMSILEMINKKKDKPAFNIFMILALAIIIVSIQGIGWEIKLVLASPLIIFAVIDTYSELYRVKTKSFMRRKKQTFEDVYNHVSKIKNNSFDKAIVDDINYKTNRTMQAPSTKRIFETRYIYRKQKVKVFVCLGLIPNAIKGIDKRDLLYCYAFSESTGNLKADILKITELEKYVEVELKVKINSLESRFNSRLISMLNAMSIFNGMLSYESNARMLYRDYTLKIKL